MIQWRIVRTIIHDLNGRGEDCQAIPFTFQPPAIVCLILYVLRPYIPDSLILFFCKRIIPSIRSRHTDLIVIMNEEHTLYITNLKTSDTVLLDGDFALVFRHARWHLLTVTYFGWKKGIHTVNFMSEARAEQELPGWLANNSQPIPFSEVSDIFAREVEAKILPVAQDYLPLLELSRVSISGGFTTDTQWVARYESNKKAAFVESIDLMMQTGVAGPYLRFYGASDRRVVCL